MIWLARVAVFMAAGTTLFFNGSWAWHAADATHHRLGLVALALAIDLCKITFLGAAAWCWAAKLRLRAVILLLLWPLAFSASTFMGYASITNQTGAADAVSQGKADDRTRLQDRYDRARDALKTAQASPEWTTSSACTVPRNASQRAYCANVRTLQRAVDDVANQLGPAPAVTAPQDLHRLARETGLSADRLAFFAAFLPALLLELLASFGSYAVGSRAEAPQRPSGRVSWIWPRMRRPNTKNAPDVVSGGSETRVSSPPTPSDRQVPSKLVWKISS